MTKRLLVLLILSLTAGIVYGQDIVLKGKLADKADNSAVAGAAIKLTSAKDSLFIKTAVTDASGNFQFAGLTPGAYVVTTSSTSHENISQRIALQASNKEAIVFSVSKQATTLADVVVTGKVAPVKQKVDTIEFAASQFKVNPDATAEDMVKKLPGITIDKDGNVTTQGDQVKKVTVDGRDFFGDDATAALRNLPADIIDKIQVFDRLSDQAAFTGFDDGNSTKAINIVTKSGMRNGQFGRIYGGYGTDNRYSAGGNVSFFKNNQRISLVGLFNNVNQQNFSSEDLLGVTSSGGGRSGGGGNRGGGRGGFGGGGGSFGGGGNNFLVGQQNGISSTNAFGINYADKWGKKLDVSGSYFFNNSNTGNDQFSNTTFLYDSANQYYNESNFSSAKNYNHRFNLRLEYKIDERNSLVFSPSLSFQKNHSMKTLDAVRFYDESNLINTSTSTTDNSSSGSNLNNNLLFRHSFAKKGRTLSVNLNAGFNNRDADIYLNSVNQYFNPDSTFKIDQFKDQKTRSSNYSANLVYTEPVGKKGQLQINYNPSLSKNRSNQQTFNYDDFNQKYQLFDTSYSNKFDNTTTSHSAGISYRVGDRDNMFAAGLNYKYLELNSDQVFPQVINVNKSFNNVLPNLMWRKKISAKSSINLMYRASTNAPSISQLQNVIDNTNPLLVTSGNPDLKQQVSNTLSARYTFTNTQKSTSFFANVFLQQANNYIANATFIARNDSAIGNDIILLKGSQLTKPINLNGYLSLRSQFTYAMPLKFIKSNFSLSGGLRYSKLPGSVNRVNTITNNYTYNIGTGVTSNISQFVDFNVSYGAEFTRAKSDYNTSLNTNYVTQNVGLQLNLLNKKGWFLQNDVRGTSYSGLGEGFNQSYWLWNAGIGKKFLKDQAGELKLSVFDLLKQNNSITRTVEANYIEDVRNQVLQQYFMLTFTYKLKNFGTAKASTGSGNNRNFPGGPQGMGNRPQF